MNVYFIFFKHSPAVKVGLSVAHNFGQRYASMALRTKHHCQAHVIFIRPAQVERLHDQGKIRDFDGPDVIFVKLLKALAKIDLVLLYIIHKISSAKTCDSTRIRKGFRCSLSVTDARLVHFVDNFVICEAKRQLIR